MDLFTPPVRKGPSSRLLKRQSLLLQQSPSTPTAATTGIIRAEDVTVTRNVAAAASMMDATATGRLAEVTQLYTYQPTAGGRRSEQFELGATENLFVDFSATCSAETATDDAARVDEALDHVAEFEQLLEEHIVALRRATAASKEGLASTASVVRQGLTEERNTWRLVGKLLGDRLKAYGGGDDDPMGDEGGAAFRSEKRLVERLFRRETKLREAQAIVHCLETNAKDHLEDVVKNSDLFGDAMLGWENTLHALQSTGGGRNANLVSSLDPDARVREGKRLHELDEQDEARLTKMLFYCIRCGMLDSAVDLCQRLGVPWRAATLVGWKLYHDPNYELQAGAEKLPIEGNPNRDLWKRSAWIISEEEKLPAQERAIYSALCGNAQQIIRSGVCNTYEDVLWTLVKAMVDVRVEDEIRSSLAKSYAEMPQKYWDNLRDLRSILDAVRASDSGQVRQEMASVFHRVQVSIMLEEWDELFEQLAKWTDNCDDPHLLRFFSHLVIILDRLGIDASASAERAEDVQEAYVRFLMRTNRAQQVAWYTSKMKDAERRASLYSRFMSGVLADADRRFVLEMAIENGLPEGRLRLDVVRRAVADHDSDDEEAKVSCLDWLLMEPRMLEEAVAESNALVRYLIASQKLEHAKSALDKVKQLNKEELEVQEAAREHYALSTYLDAKDSFSDWFKYFHQGRPIKPPINLQGDSFTQKIAQEQREKQYKIDVERWHGAVLVQSREVCARLNDILSFPGGWLRSNSSSDDQSQRGAELEYLRRTCLVEAVLLLHTVLHNTKQYMEALRLADRVAEEDVYSVFSKEDMKKLLGLLRESSIAAMDDVGSDAFGY